MRIKLLLLTFLSILFLGSLPVLGADYIVTAADDVSLSKYGLEVVSEELGMYLADEETAMMLFESGEASSICEDAPLVLPDTDEYEESISDKTEINAMSEYNDPYFSDQVYFEQNGITEYINTYDPSGEVRIAVIDTGVNRNHQEFVSANIETGYNFVLNSTDTSDTYRHGTMVTGIIAAGRNDGIGMAGIVPDATIVPLVAMTRVNGEAQGTSSNLLRAIMAAVDTYDCDIITTSLGVTSGYTEINMAVEYALSHGVIVIGAAGNSGNDSDSQAASALSYPASSPGAISVGATDQLYNRASYSQKNDRVNVVTCGGMFRMPSNTSENSYVSANGTSFSTPVIAGITALFLSEHPDITPDEYLRILEGGALYLNQDYTGEGMPDCMQMEILYNLPEGEIYIFPSTAPDDNYYELKFCAENFNEDVYVLIAYFTDGKYCNSIYSIYDGKLFFDGGINHYQVFKQSDVDTAYIFVIENFDNLKPVSNVYECIMS